MEITDLRNKYKLVKTIYFADDGYMYFSRKEAKENSLDSNSITKLSKQYVYVVDIDDLSYELKQEVLYTISEGSIDEDKAYIVLSADKNTLLLILDEDTMVQYINDQVLVGV